MLLAGILASTFELVLLLKPSVVFRLFVLVRLCAVSLCRVWLSSSSLLAHHLRLAASPWTLGDLILFPHYYGLEFSSLPLTCTFFFYCGLRIRLGFGLGLGVVCHGLASDRIGLYLRT